MSSHLDILVHNWMLGHPETFVNTPEPLKPVRQPLGNLNETSVTNRRPVHAAASKSYSEEQTENWTRRLRPRTQRSMPPKKSQSPSKKTQPPSQDNETPLSTKRTTRSSARNPNTAPGASTDKADVPLSAAMGAPVSMLPPSTSFQLRPSQPYNLQVLSPVRQPSASTVSFETPSKQGSSTTKKSSSHFGMMYGKDQIIPLSIDSDALPEGAKPLFRKIRHYCSDHRLLPESARPESTDIDDSLITDERYSDASPLRQEPGDSFDKLVAKAKYHATDDFSEDAWNTAVHYPFMELASELSGHEKSVEVMNLKSTSLTNNSYCPKTSTNIPESMRKVDFAYALRDETLLQLIKQSPSIHPINATDYLPVRIKPITILVETKLEKAKDAISQLTIWGFAQLRRWRDLFGKVPPFLPTVLFVAQDMYVVFITQTTSGGEDTGGEATYTYTRKMIGSLTDSTGALRCVATLAELCRWIVDDMLPWFRDAIQE